jgi:signal transduction histidine kinase
MKKTFKIIVKYFFPSNISSLEEQRKSALLINFLIALSTFSFIYLVLCYFTNIIVGVWTNLIMLPSCIIALFVFKSTKSFIRSSNIAVFGLAIGIAEGVLFSGNPHSPAIPWLIAVPSCAFLLGNKKIGIIWTVIVTVIILMSGLVSILKIPIPYLFPSYLSSYILTFTLIAVTIFLAIIMSIYDNTRTAMTNALAAEKTKSENLLLETQIVNQKIEAALAELKSTQAQLIQSEKMASLGELTAGIAHEIQNPLNFVNNFSEVNKEMLEELKAECLKPDAERDDVLQDDLINDVIANEEKIKHHGKRADAIVKNMLQHSRQTKGVKQPTDINALCDEYLRLSYHGLRAKDKSFNADFKTDFDETIAKINIIPQDIGRVLLNLFNNAFYAVNQQKSKNLISYEPTVSVSTKKIDNKVEIKVKDNGNGIPQNVIDKIFQPFFTTKPTGQGTGLGLSLSYDIIKAHGGEIKVESKEGEGTEFIIQLPGND